LTTWTVDPALEGLTSEFLATHALETFHDLEVPFEQIQLRLFQVTKHQPKIKITSTLLRPEGQQLFDIKYEIQCIYTSHYNIQLMRKQCTVIPAEHYLEIVWIIPKCFT
jgi:hypothetical protein